MVDSNLFKEALVNILEAIPHSVAAVVSDSDGLVLQSEVLGEEENEQIIAIVASLFEEFFERMKGEFNTGENFFTITEAENRKIAFVGAGQNATLCIIGNGQADEHVIKLIGKHGATKVGQILSNATIDPRISEIVKLSAQIRGGLPRAEFSFKIIMLGDPGVGKTSLIHRFVENRFSTDYKASIGVDISKKTICLEDRTNVNFILWDLAGDVRQMAPHRKKFYQGADCAFIVFDLADPKTFRNVESWHKDLIDQIGKKIPVILVGNKSDLQNKVEFSNMHKLAKKLGSNAIDTSAKSDINVEEAFTYCAYEMIKNRT